MFYLVIIGLAVALLMGFVALTQYEMKRGVRLWAPARATLDKQVDRIEFIIAHVDLAAFLRDEIRHSVSWVGHTVAHLTLQSVRWAERFLTRLVRYLRTEHPVDPEPPHENVREFVKTLSDFKEQLDTPEIPEIR